jgi:hypothetical protein
MLLNKFIVASDDAYKEQQEEQEQKKQILHSGMFILSQNRIIRFQTVFLKKLFSIRNLHIEQGVTHAEKRVCRFGHDYLDVEVRIGLRHFSS